MATFSEDFPRKKYCRIEIRRNPIAIATPWILLVDNRDNTVLYAGAIRADFKQVYNECLFVMNNDIIIDSYLPPYCELYFKKFENIRYNN